MKVFLAGASGAMGKRLVPLLVASGHEVVGTTTSARKADALRAAGAEPAVVDALDRDAVMTAVLRAEPDAVVHQATGLSGLRSLRKFDDAFELTNRLRTAGTDNLLEAAGAAGARRFVAQSFAGWPYARVGGPVKAEDDPLDPNPVPSMRRTLEAIRRLESAVTGAEGIDGTVLRYGGFYGPGTSIGVDGEYADLVRKRRFPIVGNGEGIWSLVRLDDAARATLAALERGRPGIYNVVDDEPAPVKEWLPALAEAIGAKPPRRVPAWLGRLAAGEAVAMLMTESRGASNAKAKAELGWEPSYASWRQGFMELSA